MSLIFSGGGIKGFALIGVIKVLVEAGELDDIDTYIGCSAGAITLLLLNAGFTWEELYDIMMNIDLSKYREMDLSYFLDNWGFDSGELLMKLIKVILKQKDICENITFKELYDKTGKTLKLFGSQLNYCEEDENCQSEFSVNVTPHMNVLDALRITAGFPGIFSPIWREDKMYVDGALLNPYPIEYSDPEKKRIGVFIHSCRKMKVKSLEDYLQALIFKTMEQYEKLFMKNYEEDTMVINIDNVESMDFAIGKEQKLEMFEKGVMVATEFLEKRKK